MSSNVTDMEQTLIDHPLVASYFLVVKDQFSLTKRELDVLQQLSIMGSSNRDLGKSLGMSEKTAKNHIASIQTKFSARSSREIQAAIFRDALLPLLLKIYDPIERGSHDGLALQDTSTNRKNSRN